MENKDELTIKVRRFGGPLVLFICLPIYLTIMVLITLKAIGSGEKLSLKIDLPNFLSAALMFYFGIWMCQRGYGWFKRKNIE